MIERSRGIVLRTIHYGETSVIAHVFTATHGTLSFCVRTGKGRRKAMRGALLCPLTIVEIDFDHRPNREVLSPKDMSVSPYTSLPYHPIKAAIALFLGEFLYYALRSEQKNTALYDYLERSLQWLDTAETGYADFHTVLLLGVARLIGFQPTEEELASLLHPGNRLATLHALNDYFRLHVPQFPELHSADILHEVLRD